MRHWIVHSGWAVISKASLSVLLEKTDWTESFKAMETRLRQICRRWWKWQDLKPHHSLSTTKTIVGLNNMQKNKQWWWCDFCWGVYQTTMFPTVQHYRACMHTFSMHPTCINDAEWWKWSQCMLLYSKYMLEMYRVEVPSRRSSARVESPLCNTAIQWRVDSMYL